MKEGSERPKALKQFEPNHNSIIKKFTIRGKPERSVLLGAWNDVGPEVMKNFFGVSGGQWVPEEWATFQEGS